jgi:hypothetical protein
VAGVAPRGFGTRALALQLSERTLAGHNIESCKSDHTLASIRLYPTSFCSIRCGISTHVSSPRSALPRAIACAAVICAIESSPTQSPPEVPRSSAILEFQDLQDIPVPRRGAFFQINYFYFEALAALREAIIAGANGQVHASFAVLRSALELMLLHAWWRMDRENREDFSLFYSWMAGTAAAPSAKTMIAELWTKLPRPGSAPDAAGVGELYGRLCAYTHKPLLGEAVTALRGGNRSEMPDELEQYWLHLVDVTQAVMLDILVSSTPACLFPIDVVRKFGFSPPVGRFFDHSNARILAVAFGPDRVKDYRQVHESDQIVKVPIDWAANRPDLSNDEIVASWSEETPMPSTSDPELSIQQAFAIVRAKMRVLVMAFAYSPVSAEMQDIGAAFYEDAG